MSEADRAAGLVEPRFDELGPVHFAGMGKLFTWVQMGEIPQLWGEFSPHFGNVPKQVGMEGYDISYAPPSGFDGFGYLAAVEVADATGVPDDLMTMQIPAHRYAVFAHRDHVHKLGETIMAVHREWLPTSGYRVLEGGVNGLLVLERYTEDFDPETGFGGMEVWMPIEG